jgi:starch-binding outer membrane protein SusE/F
MKKIILIITIALGIGLFFSGCEKNDKEPKWKLESSVAPKITNPQNDSAIILTLADSANSVFVQWSAASYVISGDAVLPTPTYSLQIAFADSSFNGAKELINTKSLSYETIVFNFNKILLTMGMTGDSTGDFELRVLSRINGVDATETSSETIRLAITTFEPPAPPEPVEKFIYLLGDATPAGWNNLAALPMTQIDNGVFARVETLDPAGLWFKFISKLGQWAPQWGTDATGTSESGPLVYRPDEATTDPPSMPSPDVLGAYYIEADTINLQYQTFLTSGELYLVGSATTVGWTAANAIPFAEVEPHIFELTTDLIDGGMKFLEVVGAWAPQWGTNDTGTGTGGPLIYRPTESVPDPAEVPSPGIGTFRIRVDLTTITYTITAK